MFVLFRFIPHYEGSIVYKYGGINPENLIPIWFQRGYVLIIFTADTVNIPPLISGYGV